MPQNLSLNLPAIGQACLPAAIGASFHRLSLQAPKLIRMSKVKLILFDLGNVVFHVNFEKVKQAILDQSDLTRKELDSKWEAFEKLNHRFERGEISTAEMTSAVNDLWSLDLSESEFREVWNLIYEEALENIDRILSILRLHYKLAVLSNTNEAHASFFPKLFTPQLQQFDKLFYSHELRSRKPEPACFQQVLDHYKMLPENVCFLDDRKENVEAAQAMGMAAIQVRDSKQMVQDLKKLGILIVW